MHATMNGVPKDADGQGEYVSVPARTLAAIDDSKAVARYEERGDPNAHHNPIMRAIYWYLAWAMPALGMFSEAYIVFSLGQTKPFQSAMWPDCFTKTISCSPDIVRTQNYIQICGIMAGMLLYGFIGDLIGRKWGSRMVALTMFTGVILLIGTPFTYGADGRNYLNFFIVAQTWYGFGVGGEYPMASSSASERSASTPHLQQYRGRQVILVFSGQGQGNFVNGCVILVCMAIFGQTGLTLTFNGSRNVIALQYGIGALVVIFMCWYRFTYLHESKVWQEEKHDYNTLNAAPSTRNKWLVSLYYYHPRLFVTCMAWIANDFAFYGSKLFQSTFISILFNGQKVPQYETQKWTVLNAFVALNGYYWAAWLVDKPWYGRRRCQNMGFLVCFVLFLVCAIRFPYLSTNSATKAGTHWFQFLYFFSSFWVQFGPNATTWLVAGEVFPTDIRAFFHGISACAGKLGAIVSDVAFSYISLKTSDGKTRNAGYELIFYLNAAFCVYGFICTWIWLPDTTGLMLDENDRLHKYALTGEFSHYHGEAVNPRHLSPWEIYVLGWHKSYDPEADRRHREVTALELAKQGNGMDMEKPQYNNGVMA